MCVCVYVRACRRRRRVSATERQRDPLQTSRGMKSPHSGAQLCSLDKLVSTWRERGNVRRDVCREIKRFVSKFVINKFGSQSGNTFRDVSFLYKTCLYPLNM